MLPVKHAKLYITAFSAVAITSALLAFKKDDLNSKYAKKLQDTTKTSLKKPEDNRFTKTILSNDLNEPIELCIAPDGRV